LPYIVEKDYARGTYLTVDAEAGDGLLVDLDPPGEHPNVIYVANLLDESGLITLLQAGAAVIYDDTEGFDTGTGDRGNTEPITILNTGTDADGRHYIYLDPAIHPDGLLYGYTGQLSGNLYQTDLALSERVEFDIPIKGRWCKLAQIKIVQQTAGDMEISFEVWEQNPVFEGNRLEMHKNVLRRNIVLTAIQGGWYGESLVNNLILYKDRNTLVDELADPPAPGESLKTLGYNLHCALVNEAGGTVSDFHVLLKIAEIGERV